MRPYWQGHWQKAESNLRSARLLLTAGEYAPCIGCAYFAAFHAAITALLKWTDYRSKEWRHKTVQAEFARLLIHRRKIFPQRMASILSELMDLRHEADYSPEPISSEKARWAVQTASKFLDAVRDAFGGERS
jgi:uncharacterized protein (UPF0332 family)